MSVRSKFTAVQAKIGCSFLLPLKPSFKRTPTEADSLFIVRHTRRKSEVQAPRGGSLSCQLKEPPGPTDPKHPKEEIWQLSHMQNLSAPNLF